MIIDIGKEIASIIMERDSIKEKVIEKIKRHENEKIIIDFKNVEFISMAATHELLYYIKQQNISNIKLINMNKDVKKMIDLVKKILNIKNVLLD